MRSWVAHVTVLAAAGLVAVCGCAEHGAHWLWCPTSPFRPQSALAVPPDTDYYLTAATRIEYADVNVPDDELQAATPPTTILNNAEPEYWDLTLEEAVQLAAENSKVLRDLGGFVLRSPDTAGTVQDPSIVETDPRFGVEAALSAFDASFATSAFFEKNDRQINNQFFGGGTRLLKQDLVVVQSEIAKRAATGTEFFVRNLTTYDANNAPGNAFPSTWETIYEAEARHPLLQGAGVDFNRIAGPSDTPGVYNGVLIARINSDISLADFEIGVRNFISDVENAYWDLYFAYRDLDAKKRARDTALATWKRVNALKEAGRRGGEAFNEAQTREQYFRFEEEVQNALTGRLLEGTRTNNGSTGGTFRATGGVLVAERRLRLVMGVPLNDGRMVRPIDDPPMAQVLFNWEAVVKEALSRRPELRRQKWQIRQRELELQASKNFLLPQLDTVGRYRWRGLGHDLFENGIDTSAYDELMGGDFQEWQLGVELSFPFGYRRAHAGVRNAELRLARERTVLVEQERQVVHDLSNAIAEVDRAYTVLQTSYNGRAAALTQLEALEAAYEADQVDLDLILDAQRRLTDAENRFYRALVEYALAIKNVHLEKGSLLDYNDIFLREGPWPAKAYADAEERESLRGDRVGEEHVTVSPPDVSDGTYPQQLDPPADAHELGPDQHGPAGSRTDEDLAPPPTDVTPPTDGSPPANVTPPTDGSPPSKPPAQNGAADTVINNSEWLTSAEQPQSVTPAGHTETQPATPRRKRFSPFRLLSGEEEGPALLAPDITPEVDDARPILTPRTPQALTTEPQLSPVHPELEGPAIPSPQSGSITTQPTPVPTPTTPPPPWSPSLRPQTTLIPEPGFTPIRPRSPRTTPSGPATKVPAGEPEPTHIVPAQPPLVTIPRRSTQSPQEPQYQPEYQVEPEIFAPDSSDPRPTPIPRSASRLPDPMNTRPMPQTHMLQPQPDSVPPYGRTPQSRNARGQSRQQNPHFSRRDLWGRNQRQAPNSLPPDPRGQRNQRGQYDHRGEHDDPQWWSPVAPIKKFNDFMKDAFIPDRWGSRRR